METTLLGVVLAGGLSSRMGQDKAHLSLSRGGVETFLDRAWHCLGSVTHSRIVSTRHSVKLGPVPYPCVYDACEHLGPVGALYTCLRLARSENFTGILALACDLPKVTGNLLQFLSSEHTRRNPATIATLFCRDNWFIEPLCAIYDVACLPYFTKAVEEQNQAVFAVVPIELQNRIHKQPEGDALFNVNTQDDLTLLRQKQ